MLGLSLLGASFFIDLGIVVLGALVPKVVEIVTKEVETFPRD